VIPSCFECLLGTQTTPSICDAADIKAAIAAVNACAEGCCYLVCDTPVIPCNPVTNAPCNTGNGEACEPGSGGTGYQCFVEPTDEGLCEMCDGSMFFCQGGDVCLPDGGCAKYCCDDGDCGSGYCDKTMLPGETTIGVCLHK
jgi:hypothetical protein